MKKRKGVIKTNERRTGKYILPRAVYNMTVWMIRDYERMLDNEEFYKGKIEAIEAACATVPSEYMIGVWNNITQYAAFPNDAHRVTYARYKSRFIHKVATSVGFYPQSATPEH